MHYTSRDVARPAEVLPWLRDLPEDLTPWLDEAGLPDGLPFLLSPRYEYDVVLNSYFHRVSLIDAPWNSNANRARALAAFLNFLHASPRREVVAAGHRGRPSGVPSVAPPGPGRPQGGGRHLEPGGLARQPVL